MADTFEFHAIKPDGEVLREPNAIEVVVPGAHGYFGVRAGHHPFVTPLGVGQLTVKTAVGSTRLMVADGFCEVVGVRVTVLAETAERAEDIDVATAERMRDRMRDRIEKGADAETLERAHAELKRAEAMLSVARPG